MNIGKIVTMVFILSVAFFLVGCPEPPPEPPPPPPPPPEPSPPWIGTSCYQAIIFPLEDVEWYIKNVAESGGNATEFFLTFVWPMNRETHQSYPHSGWKFTPYKIVKYETEPKYGDYQFPVFDISKDGFREEIWAKWKRIFEICRENGVVPFIRIQDYVSVKHPFYKRHYPFQRNIQKGVEYTGGMWGEKIRKFYAYLNQKLIQTLNEAECQKYFIIPMNEANVLDSGWSDEEKDKRCIDFHKWYIQDLQKYGCQKEQIIMNTSRAFGELKKLGHVMEIHGVNSDVTLKEKMEIYGTENVSFNGDGPDKNAKGRASFNGNREPSVKQAEEINKIVKENELFGYCYFNRAIEPKMDDVNIRYAKFDVLKALTKEIETSL